MSTRAVFTTLWCPKCLADTTHLVMYAGHYLKVICCTQCQRSLFRSPSALRREYVHDLPARACDLARRSVREAHQHPVDFLKHLPTRLVMKPLEISSEIYAILSEAS